MNLYKFNFDLAGSSNAVQTITIPSDSKYSMGLKFFKGSEELVIGDDVKITIQDDKYIYTPTEIFNNYAVFAGATGSDAGESKTYQVNFHKDADEDLPEVNANFKGVNVKTNDSNISNWAITDSQMKVVYTDEWETMKDNADDRVIYFVVDKPTPPKPVPPKPTPSGDVKWGVMLIDVPESDTFDPTSIEDCINTNPGLCVKYTRDGVDYYVYAEYGSSTSAEKREEDEAIRNDQIGLVMIDFPEDDVYIGVQCVYVKDGYLNINEFKKHFNNDTELYEYMDNYDISRFGEDGEQPNTSNPIPADFDTWEINDEESEPVPITNETDEYVYLEGLEDVVPPIKLFKNMDTFVQWRYFGEPT